MLQEPLRNNPRGFTLTELSVVLVIVALLVGMSISATQPILQQARINATTKKMAAIEQALLKFSAANGRIPCPTDLTLTQGSANYGQEAGYATGGVGAGECQHNLTPAANFATATTGGTAEGGVPTATLNLPNDFMYDGWGHKFRYVVDPTYTLSTQHSAWPIPSYISCTSSSTGITINDESGAARTQKAIYAIISHGPNGHGAYTSSGQITNAGIQATDEQTNCHCNATGAHTGGATTLSSATYVQKDPQYQSGQASKPLYYFDDIVTYKEGWQMQASNNFAPSACPYLYTTDFWNGKVRKTDLLGGIITTWGNGTSDSKVGTGPSDVKVDSSGNIWISDCGNNRVMKFNSSGTWQMTIGGKATNTACAGTYASSTTCNAISGFGAGCCAPKSATCNCTSGSGNGELNCPTEIAIDSSGNIWVADNGNGRVEEFNSSGQYVNKWSITDGVSGLAVDSNRYVWLTTPYDSSLRKCSAIGSCASYTSYDMGAPHNLQACDTDYIAVDSNGNIWVTDESNGKVREFNSSTGAHITDLSTSFPYTSGSCNGPTAIAFDSFGYLWVGDRNNNNIYQINPNSGSILKTISSLGLNLPMGLTVSSNR
jgi:prepilin-type N-terminal cleavage/methylation domain-containing protein